MSGEKKSLQDKMLEVMRGKKMGCVLFTTNGVQIHGKVKSYDAYTVLMEDDKSGKQNLVYKHAISTIQPNEFVRLDEAE